MRGTQDARQPRQDHGQETHLPAGEGVAIRAHLAPFLAWLAILALPLPEAWNYAARCAVGLILLAMLRPWRWYGTADWRGAWPAMLVGTAVFILWVGPETEWVRAHFGTAYRAYRHWATGDATPGAVSVWETRSLHDPLLWIRAGGSALLIAPIEEFFWRGFVYRRLVDTNFTRTPARGVRWWPFLITTALFGLEHSRWLAGLAAGAAYGWMYTRRGNLWDAIIAHATTNLLLGVYVVTQRAFTFW